MTLARFDTGQVEVRKEAVGLRELVEQAWSAVADVARQRRLSFANELSPEAVVHSDRDKLRLLLGNLLGNATAYTAEGGQIIVRAGLPPTLFEVADSGPPIATELLPRLFDRFVRGDAARVGTGQHAGIGLAVVRAVSRHLGLTARAENRPDGTVAFVIAGAP